jgi:hypothetical protein
LNKTSGGEREKEREREELHLPPPLNHISNNSCDFLSLSLLFSLSPRTTTIRETTREEHEKKEKKKNGENSPKKSMITTEA